MKYSEHALNILTAKTFKGIGDAWIIKNLSQVICVEQIIELLAKKVLITEHDFLAERKRIEQKITQLGDSCDGIVALGDPNFPQHRGHVKDGEKPTVLFYKGDISLLSQKNVNIAVIGVLNPDADTEQEERQVVRKLVENHAVIVSGLAFGCDSIAHDETVKADGMTVAILPSPLNNIQPARNRALAQEIVEHQGLLISEYFEEPRMQMERNKRYIDRDRLQALFSDIVILSASYKLDSVDPNNPKIDSGSRHAMNKAKEYGIKRGVIYDERHEGNPKYDLNRQILNERGVLRINPNQLQDLNHVMAIKNHHSSPQIQNDLFG